MFDARVSPDDALAARAAAVRARFEANGVNVSEWARARNFAPKLVHEILRGDRRCKRGKSHQIAVALGIKDRAASGEQTPPDAALDHAATHVAPAVLP